MSLLLAMAFGSGSFWGGEGREIARGRIGVTRSRLAKGLNVPVTQVQAIIAGRRGITSEAARGVTRSGIRATSPHRAIPASLATTPAGRMEERNGLERSG